MKPVQLFLGGLILFAFISSCNQTGNENTSDQSGTKRKLPSGITYSYECLKDSGDDNNGWEKADEIINKLVTYNIDVSDEEQMRYGDTFLLESLKKNDFKIYEGHKAQYKLDTILQKLVTQRNNPSNIQYKIFVLDDDTTVNAYTIGGKIFITTAMLKQTKNNDQLYAIIGHEIGHNEKGHIKNTLKQVKAGKKYLGDWGEAVVAIKRILTGSFNQKKELEADYYGLDLTWKAGYDICAIKQFWDQMAKAEQKQDWLSFFRTHPYSDVRSRCLTNHITKNFELNCK
ncbi:MAG TPA: M48 family metallopeptidase [Ferruginibacter sp.]|nr:M48 family metallopeptidase [Ferruginibacter sp.]HRE64947.1 M48 family metallopeptidase [Ferruginibacter sp.]